MIPVDGKLLVLTGASGSGKTTIAEAARQASVEKHHFLFFDSIEVPAAEEMLARFGEGHQPGGAWQRAMTIDWFARIANLLKTGRSVMFEGQMRIAFIDEAMQMAGISSAHVVLVDCDDNTRLCRLTGERAQPELANESMFGWARYLRAEALERGYPILDTSILPIAESSDLLLRYLAG